MKDITASFVVAARLDEKILSFLMMKI